MVKIQFICCDPDTVRKGIAGKIINVKLEDFDRIDVWKIEKIKNRSSSTAGGETVIGILCILTMGLFCPG